MVLVCGDQGKPIKATGIFAPKTSPIQILLNYRSKIVYIGDIYLKHISVKPPANMTFDVLALAYLIHIGMVLF